MKPREWVWVMLDGKSVEFVFSSLEACLQKYPERGLFVSRLAGGLFLGKDFNDPHPFRLYRLPIIHFDEVAAGDEPETAREDDDAGER